jgi:hypothetical protein
MALTILCGSTLSMLSTLFIVPCAYSVMESAKKWMLNLLPRRELRGS